MTAPTPTRASDAYRRLAIKLFSPDAGGRAPRTIAVVALDGRSDTSVIVANVATALALARRRVVAASRRSAVPPSRESSACRPPPGLTDVLLRETSLNKALQPTAIGALRILPGGTNGSATAVLLDYPGVHEVLGRLRLMADVVLVDAAANAAVEAGSVIAECDVVVVVGTFGGTSVERARRTLSELALRGKRDIRVVMYSRRPFVARPARHRLPGTGRARHWL